MMIPATKCHHNHPHHHHHHHQQNFNFQTTKMTTIYTYKQVWIITREWTNRIKKCVNIKNIYLRIQCKTSDQRKEKKIPEKEYAIKIKYENVLFWVRRVIFVFSSFAHLLTNFSPFSPYMFEKTWSPWWWLAKCIFFFFGPEYKFGFSVFSVSQSFPWRQFVNYICSIFVQLLYLSQTTILERNVLFFLKKAKNKRIDKIFFIHSIENLITIIHMIIIRC